MKKEAFVYILIFIISFGLTSATLFFITKNRKTSGILSDSLKHSLKTDSLVVDTSPINQAKVKEPSDKPVVSYSDTEKEFLKLVEKIKTIHGLKTEEPANKEEQDKHWAIVDSTLTALKKEVENYKKDKERLTRDISEYKASLRKKDDVIKNQNTRILDYEQKIATIRSDFEKETKEQKDKESAESLKNLVKIYNNMDPKKAAEFIQNMPMSKGVVILKALNQKKAAKILASMRPQMAAAYSQKMAE